jgi:formate dehydrogenase maturation protein FdhE
MKDRINFQAWQGEYERLLGSGGIHENQPCPECGEALPVLTVKKEGKNQGRPFITCPSCDTFAWQDVPSCRSCGANLLTLTVKKDGPNKGRKFRMCPNRCPGHFRWL